MPRRKVWRISGEQLRRWWTPCRVCGGHGWASYGNLSSSGTSVVIMALFSNLRISQPGKLIRATPIAFPGQRFGRKSAFPVQRILTYSENSFRFALVLAIRARPERFAARETPSRRSNVNEIATLDTVVVAYHHLGISAASDMGASAAGSASPHLHRNRCRSENSPISF